MSDCPICGHVTPCGRDHGTGGVGAMMAVYGPQQPAALLRDTAEDRERLARAEHEAMSPCGNHTESWDDHEEWHLGRADAILAALRGEA